MGTCKIWYWPNSGTTAQEVDLGVPIRMRHGPTSRFKTLSSEAMTGEITTTQFMGLEEMRLEHTWGGVATAGRTLRRSLKALVNHLQQGGHLAIAEDSTYAFAAFLSPRPSSTSTVVRYKNNLFASFAPSADIDGREVDLVSDPDTHITEMGLVSAHNPTNSTVALSSGLVFDYAQTQYLLLREHGCHPCLRVPEPMRNDEMLTHERETVFYLDIPLEADPTSLAYLFKSGATPPGTTPGRSTLPGKDVKEGTDALAWWNRR